MILYVKPLKQGGSVTKSKLILITMRQANKKERDEMLGRGIATLSRKLADREDGGLVSQNHLPQVKAQASFILKGEGVWLVVANLLVRESFVLAAVHVGPVTMFL